MPDFYKETHRTLQEEFGTRGLADRLEQVTIAEEISEEAATFVQSQDKFFLSTLDEAGNPTVSHKGGAKGFVRVLNPNTLLFPNYDGNGMFLSMGNIAGQAKVGMLFIDFEAPHRMRLQGTARLLREGPLFESYPGADLVVEVQVAQTWVNCPRYIHRYQSVEKSSHVPDSEGNASFAVWKRIDALQDVLSPEDKQKAEAAGLISMEDYQHRVESGTA
jgi:predicted pyridoxine 5'-phosphate oxidase superfamily flavin-nucleotide-binding protein